MFFLSLSFLCFVLLFARAISADPGVRGLNPEMSAVALAAVSSTPSIVAWQVLPHFVAVSGRLTNAIAGRIATGETRYATAKAPAAAAAAAAVVTPR